MFIFFIAYIILIITELFIYRIKNEIYKNLTSMIAIKLKLVNAKQQYHYYYKENEV